MNPSREFEQDVNDEIVIVEIPDIRDSFQKATLYKKVKMTNHQKEKFKEYLSLPYSHVKGLSATNYWRIYNGMPEIAVPPQDLYYWKYFDSRIYDIVKAKKERDRRFAEINDKDIKYAKLGYTEANNISEKVEQEIKQETGKSANSDVVNDVKIKNDLKENKQTIKRSNGKNKKEDVQQSLF